MRLTRFIPLLLLQALQFACTDQESIDFSAQVKPIINKRCISCHGGVKRNNGFSLLFRQDALDTTESGKPAIIPGDVENSELIKRITHHDPEERMPYKEDPLPEDEIKILTQWIKEGAKWGDHWAYIPPKEVQIPGTESMAGFFSSEEFVRNNIDRFVLQKLEEKGMEHNDGAEPEVLLRRVYLDIIGIPPSVEQVQSFINNGKSNAYEQVVDDLLMSPKFGEKWASWWLDMARYADTKGYEKDASRVIWRYRDWVIRAFNSDKPFDVFTIEQLAGDLLPNPTVDQYVATGFHRNTMNNDEGGTDDEEFRVATVIDRLNTTYQVWQSTTFGCVQCHSHPYDPFRHEEYYQSMAFFNNTRDEDTQGDYPKLRFYEEKDSSRIEELLTWFGKRDEQRTRDLKLFLKTLEPKIHAHVADQYVNGALVDTKWMGVRHGGQCRIPGIDLDGKDFMLVNYYSGNNGGRFELTLDNPSGEILASGSISKSNDWETIRIPVKKTSGKKNLYWKFFNPTIDAGSSVCLIEWFAFQSELPGKGEPGFDAARTQFMEMINKSVPETPIFIENGAEQKRNTHVFERGNWMVKGQVVQAHTPRSLNPWQPTDKPDRLALANWLISTDNPLTARTIVNRIWEQIYGNGLVYTIEDFGTQGEPPSHPELLDYLALKLSKDYKWSMKSLIREIVLSGTYRQSSVVKDWESDPTNKWLARGPRFRLTAEQVRDQALHVSRLLSDKMYGPGVMPYQPDKVWQSVYNGEEWRLSEGEDRFRRGVYTFIKRTSTYPTVMIFDGSSREVCLSQRVRTNTPLQSLATLNDPVYVEAARAFANSIDASLKPTQQIRTAYRQALLQDIDEENLVPLQDLYVKSLENFQTDNKALQQIMNCDSTDANQAALTVVCLAIFNLDEFLTKE